MGDVSWQREGREGAMSRVRLDEDTGTDGVHYISWTPFLCDIKRSTCRL